MFNCRTNVSNDTFADTGDDSRFTGAADQTVNIGAYGNAGFDLQFDAVFSNCRNYRRFNYFGVNAHLHCFQYITSGKVNSAGTLKRQRDLSSVSSDQRIDDTVNVAAGQIMRFQLIDIDVQTCLISFDKRQHDLGSRHAAEPHTH